MDAIAKAREILKDITPLKKNCGKICGAACCQSDETGENGMLLFPGEEQYYLGKDGYRVEDGRVICTPPCDRQDRPLACRMFPLIVLENGKVDMDIRAWPVCPLMRGGMRGLDEHFVAAVKEAAMVLAADETQAAFLARLTSIISSYESLKSLW